MNPVALAQTTREYRMSLGWRIFVYLFAPVFIVGGIFLGILPFIDDTITPGAEYIFIPMGLALSLLMVYALLEAHYGIIRLSQGRIEQVSVFGNKELLISEIKGFEADEYYIRVYPLAKGKPTIKIGVIGIESQEIIQWLQLRKHNLEEVTYQYEEEELLSNQALGSTEQERLANLENTRKLASWLNGGSFAIGGWLFFYPTPYKAAVLAGAIYPLLLAGVMLYYKGIFKLNTKNKSAHPSLFGGILLAGLGVALRALTDINLFSYGPILPWIGGVTLLIFLLLTTATKEFQFNKIQGIGMGALFFCMMAFYGYGVSVMANVLLDNSAPEIYTAQVTDKHISNGNSTTYYLTLEPWGPRTEPEDISVSSEFYETVPVGANIPVQLYQGALNTPWLVVE
ncbi:hypothetical protein [Rufibacter tibetensis]|uniref:Uncharacterized protein n=1 Tax=Rufibacter tibetensis TaxID=512763 RepID=A0A0P0CBQ2_9BACT|nr:hypothetical protein [Rufibacter tibetensis]ALI99089.1 hypothetical protein DC20_09020 [Rufibacter tibetensis]